LKSKAAPTAVAHARPYLKRTSKIHTQAHEKSSNADGDRTAILLSIAGIENITGFEPRKPILSFPKGKIMERKMKTSHIILAAALIAIAFEPTLAVAQTSGGTGDIFQTLQQKGAQTFTNVRNISFIVGAFGLVAIGVMAYFGRFNWKHFAALIGGLVIISGAASAIRYVTGQDNSSGASTQPTLPGITDTFNGQ